MPKLNRRSFLGYAGAGAATFALPSLVYGASAKTVDTTLTMAKATVPIVGPPHPETEVWTFNGSVPGPVLRVPQGGRLRVTARNRLDQSTTIHWHGIRLPNAMDGVAPVTQPAIAPGQDFVYEFDLPDAGSYWYHPHVNGAEQVGRGLAGALIVDEPNPPKVDRDIIWVLDDWRLDRQASIVGNFKHPRDLAHAGRLGNSVTINGRIPRGFKVRAGERVRLRLINVANARTFGLRFEGLAPMVIARDGQPVTPHAPDDDMVLLAAAQRADLIIDMTGKPGSRSRVIDDYYRGNAYRLVSFVYGDTPPLRETPPDWSMTIAANPLPKPDLKAAKRHDLLLQGGAMSGMMRMGPRGGSGGMMGRGMSPGGGPGMAPGMMRFGSVWALNDRSMAEGASAGEPLFRFKRGETQIIAMRNETAFEHPMHLHGHTFRMLSRNGKPVARQEWLDTALVAPRETVEIAFVADNPGAWAFHCHVLEHMAAGMMAIVRVG